MGFYSVISIEDPATPDASNCCEAGLEVRRRTGEAGGYASAPERLVARESDLRGGGDRSLRPTGADASGPSPPGEHRDRALRGARGAAARPARGRGARVSPDRRRRRGDG